MTYNKEANDIYYSMHSLCPSCGKDDVERRCIGQWFRDSETFKDENKAMCSCGWVGIVHDLVPNVFPLDLTQEADTSYNVDNAHIMSLGICFDAINEKDKK